jgi:hypothetical protein
MDGPSRARGDSADPMATTRHSRLHCVIPLQSFACCAAVVLAALAPLEIGGQGRAKPRQATRPSAKVAKPEAPPPAWLQEPFDLSISALPVGFAGHDLEALSVNLQRTTAPKGEFETTDGYNARIKAATLRPVVGTVTPTSVLAFVFPKASARYDADKAILVVGVELEDSGERNTRRRPRSAAFFVDKRTSERYQGSNAYGVTTEVTRIRATIYLTDQA